MPAMSPVPADALLALSTFAQTLADQVRPVSRRWFRSALQVDLKADESPVTRADREVETALRQAISSHYPHHGIFGEEFGASQPDAEFTWSVDPIDGTRSFISGHPLWGTLLAALHRGSPIVGIIDMPMLDERWLGVKGAATLFNGVQCRTSDCKTLSRATLYATSPDIFLGAAAEAFDGLSLAVGMRRFGGDCYSYGLLASGHIDLVVEAGLQPYDYLALTPVIEGAGGIITDWAGQALSLESQGCVVAAATQELHQQAIQALVSREG